MEIIGRPRNRGGKIRREGARQVIRLRGEINVVAAVINVDAPKAILESGVYAADFKQASLFARPRSARVRARPVMLAQPKSDGA